jgi:hypothetical protein
MSSKKPDSEHGDEPDTSELGGVLQGAAAGGAEGTEVLGDSPEDVLVLLPEGTDVPLVETEAVDDVESNTDLVGGAPTIPIEDVALRDLNPLAEDAPIGGGEPDPTPPTENLEDLATEMDDEFLAPEAPAPATGRRRSAADHAPRRAVPQFIPSVEEGVERPRSRRKLPLVAAALLAMAAAGYLTFPKWRSYVEPYLPLARAEGKKKSSPPVASKGSVAVPGTKVETGPADGSGTTKATDIVRASKEAFREKFLLSIELGFVGEVADE